MGRGKRPASLFYWGDWRRNPNLCRCTKAAKGVWVDMLAVAFECDEPGVLATEGKPWTIEEIAGAIGGDVPVNMTLILELSDKGVVRRNKNGALYSGRMVRDEEEYQQAKAETRDRVRKHRENDNVTGDVTPAVTDDVTAKKRRCTEGVTVTEPVVGIGFSLTPIQELQESIDRTFAFYCQTFKRNPDKYQLTEKRRKKAEIRFAGRLKIHQGDLAAVEAEAKIAIENLAASEWHIANSFIDWEDQLFRSDEEYQKKLNMEPKAKQVGNGQATNAKLEHQHNNRAAIVQAAMGAGLRGGHGHTGGKIQDDPVPGKAPGG